MHGALGSQRHEATDPSRASPLLSLLSNQDFKQLVRSTSIVDSQFSPSLPSSPPLSHP
jgi:hypothetical protein